MEIMMEKDTGYLTLRMEQEVPVYIHIDGGEQR